MSEKKDYFAARTSLGNSYYYRLAKLRPATVSAQVWL